MARDRRTYRFVQDTRDGPVILTESMSSDDIVQAITKYVARRIVERERALATHDRTAVWYGRRRWSLGGVGMFALGLVLGIVAVLVAAFVLASKV
jgi:hypothetical protein